MKFMEMKKIILSYFKDSGEDGFSHFATLVDRIKSPVLFNCLVFLGLKILGIEERLKDVEKKL